MKSRFVISGGSIIETLDEEAPVLVYVAPDNQEKQQIASTFHLDPYDVESALDPDEVSRLEITRDYLVMIWKRPKSATADEQVRLEVSSFGVFLLKERLLFILSEGPIPFAAKEFSAVSKTTDLLLRFLLHTIRHYVGHLKVIKQMSTALEAKISASMENRYLLQMFTLSENLVYYLDAIEGNGTVLTKLRAVTDRLAMTVDQINLLDDIILENNQCARQAQIYSTVLSGLMDARGTIVNNNMNVLLKNLTLINIVFLPLNLIAGILGMSEFSMMTSGVHWAVSYSLFTLGMVVLGWLTWVMMIRFIEKNPARKKKNTATLG
ncbi:MAG: magnesium transporter CorA family protein [Candidatus Sumerlaeia bacterium]